MYPPYARVIGLLVVATVSAAFSFGWLDKFEDRTTMGEPVAVRESVPLSQEQNFVDIAVWDGGPQFVPRVEHAVIATDGLELRTSPGRRFDVVGTLREGDEVTILTNSGEWFRVRTESNRHGWVEADGLRLIPPIVPRDGSSVTYRIEADTWQVEQRQAEQTEDIPLHRLTVARLGEGVLHFTWERNGLSGEAPIAAVDSRRGIAVQAQTEGETALYLPIGSDGVQAIAANENGLWIQGTETTPGYRVLDRRDGRWTIELSPIITAVEEMPSEQGVMFHVRGSVQPVWLDADADSFGRRLLLRGARSLVPADGLPEGWSYVVTEQGTVLQLPSEGALIKQAPGRLALEYPRRGLAGKVIVIDPGHGGDDPGGVDLFGEYEREYNLRVAKLLAARLEQAGAHVVLTRLDDSWAASEEAINSTDSADEKIAIDLSARSGLANGVWADLFVSIHHDSGAASYNGVQTYYFTSNRTNGAWNRLLADTIQQELAQLGKLRDRGIGEMPFHVLRNVRVPAVLVELGFLTNRSDLHHVKDPEFQLVEAQALLRGIEAFFDEAEQISAGHAVQ